MEIYDGDQFFHSGKRHKFAKIEKPCLYQPLLFSCLRFVSRWMRYAVNILEDFTKIQDYDK